MIYTYIPSPVGRLFLAKDNKGLRKVAYAAHVSQAEIPVEWERKDQAFGEERRQFAEYFAGKRKKFELPLAPEATPFQKKVLRALQSIPFGQTRSYGQIARAIGQPKAARAVGMANNRNPISIIIPCHRVIGANGKLVGYGGGLKNKEKLLTLEHYPAVSRN